MLIIIMDTGKTELASPNLMLFHDNGANMGQNKIDLGQKNSQKNRAYAVYITEYALLILNHY